MKETVINLNTGIEGSSFTTKIDGSLKALIIKNQNKVDIEINSEHGYLIFKQLQHEGISYFPIKSVPLDKESQKLNYTSDDYHLKENITINVSGSRDQDITIIVRYV